MKRRQLLLHMKHNNLDLNVKYVKVNGKLKPITKKVVAEKTTQQVTDNELSIVNSANAVNDQITDSVTTIEQSLNTEVETVEKIVDVAFTYDSELLEVDQEIKNEVVDVTSDLEVTSQVKNKKKKNVKK